MTSDFGAQSQLEKIDMLDYAELVVLNKFDRRRVLQPAPRAQGFITGQTRGIVSDGATPAALTAPATSRGSPNRSKCCNFVNKTVLLSLILAIYSRALLGKCQ